MNLPERIKQVMIEELNLSLTEAEIGDDALLFGPESALGLDSVDALQLVVAIEKHFGLKLSDQAEAKQVLQSVASIAAAIEASQAQS